MCVIVSLCTTCVPSLVEFRRSHLSSAVELKYSNGMTPVLYPDYELWALCTLIAYFGFTYVM